MIKMGQPGRAPANAIEPVQFAHPSDPGLGMEVMALAELRRRVPPHHRRVPSRPSFHQLLLVESGRLEHEVDFERYRCGAGSVLHVRAGQVQRFLGDSGSSGWALLFTPESLPPTRGIEVALGPGGRAAFTLPPGDLPAFAPAMKALAAACDAGSSGPGWTPVLGHLLSALLLMIAHARGTASTGGSRHPATALKLHERFLRELELGFTDTRTTTDYAQRIGTTPKSLVRACNAVAGTTPKQLIELRVSLEAKRLLAHSNLSVSAIGTELGFSEPTNFVKFFGRCEGMTPLAFRGRFRGGGRRA